jgi:hypothetical protein
MPWPKRRKRPTPVPIAPPSRKSATKRQLAQEQQVSLRTIDQWIADHKIPVKKLSPRLTRFDLDAVQAALDRYTVQEVK